MLRRTYSQKYYEQVANDTTQWNKQKGLSLLKILVQARLMLGKSGTPGESRTPNLLIRSQALYPIELRVQKPKIKKILIWKGWASELKPAILKATQNYEK